ncbi:MAG TPA: HemK2/MTQ2 family protein methyltransferase [Candidatus Nanoarchaeia archaeon]|nr:HemK2/MTQ2 family protein methyltransferase [Candidatus Nanoarchaeia archaeon]
MIYSPSDDSFLMLKAIKERAKNQIVLDMGTGFGILAETALKSGAKSVLAADINPASIAYVKSKNIPAIVSDLFSNIQGKFDLILFNPPYLPEDPLEDEETRRIVCGGKHGYEIIIKFLKQARAHLNRGGEILLIFSSLTNRKKIDQTLKELKYKQTLLDEESHFYEVIYLYSCRI